MADEFLESLPRTRKEERASLIIGRVVQLAENDGTDAVEKLVDGIAGLGKRWHKLVVRALENFLGHEPSSLHAPIIQHQIERITRVQLVLRERETGARLTDICGLLGRLERLQKHPRPSLSVRFETDHAYVYGLCAIAAWASAHASRIDVDSDSPRVENFLERAGVIKGMQDSRVDPVQFDTNTILGFTRIDPGAGSDADVHAGRLVRLFQENIPDLPQDSAKSLSICFAELIENVVKHGAIESPAWLFANFHPQFLRMHVCICDRGIGVQKTFLNSQDVRLQELALHARDWLREASEPLVTSKSEGHAGYGLYLARELCRRNGGSFAMASGGAAFSLHPSSPESQFADVEEWSGSSPDWHGTLVAMQFRLDRPLELGPVWETLSSDDEDLDLFDD